MSKFVVTYGTGEEIEVEADSFDVEEDGRLVFSEEVDDFLPEEWTAIRDEDDEGEGDEDETAEDLVDRLEETFADDDMVLACSQSAAGMLWKLPSNASGQGLAQCGPVPVLGWDRRRPEAATPTKKRRGLSR